MQLYTLRGLHRWSTIRARGKLRFVVLYGMIYYGLLYDLLPLALLLWILGVEFSSLLIAGLVAGCVILGILYSLLVWAVNERRFPGLAPGAISPPGSTAHDLAMLSNRKLPE